MADLTVRLDAARAAVQQWKTAKPKTAARNRAAASAILVYAEVDELLSAGAPLPGPWAERSVALPTVEEVAEALGAVGMMMPVESAPVMMIARQVVKVMTVRRSRR